MTVALPPAAFSDRERLFVQWNDLQASLFRFDTGVLAVRLRSPRGELVMLPFQGQQIWSAQFDGRDLTMRSMFEAPNPTRDYLQTYGGFLIHCGATRMGVPGPHDTHPLHGELPNAPYQSAFLTCGEDERGPYLGLGGRFQYTVAFNDNYAAEPLVKLYAQQPLIHAMLQLTNLKRSPMELMYLAHINLRPVDHGQLIYSAPVTPEHVRVRASIPSHIRPQPGYAEFLQTLATTPELHHHLTPGLAFDPEVVFSIDYQADAEGWAHTMQLHPDGHADMVAHRPDQLDKNIRWISRTADQDALGMSMPATAEPEGYSAEKAKGHIRSLAAGARFQCDFLIGTLNPEQAQQYAQKIRAMVP